MSLPPDPRPVSVSGKEKEKPAHVTGRYNVGGVDRTIRGIIGAGMVFIGLFILDGFSLNHLGLLIMALGLYPMVTSQMAICPIYKIFGISTRTARDIEKEKEFEEDYEKDYH